MSSNPVQPALDTLAQLRIDLKSRIGKEGGNLNRLMLTRLDVIDATLKQVEPLNIMAKMLNQQSELLVQGLRQLSKPILTISEGNGETTDAKDGADDGTSETKGQ